MPKELICVGPSRLEWREYQEPALPAGHVLVKAQFGAAKHGTEMAMVKGYANPRGPFDRQLGVFTYQPRGGYPCGVGNMVVGAITEIGADVAGLAVGDRVVTYGTFKPTHISETRHCWKIPKELSWKSAVCLDPADFAMAAVRDGHVRVGDAAAVFGLGAIGLMAVQLCKLGGAGPIIAVDPVEQRRQIALQLGATHAVDSAADAGLEIKKITGGRGADVVIEYSGHWKAMQAALRGVAYGGTVVSGAFPPPYEAGLDFGAESHLNIPNIVFSRSCSHPNRDHPRWDEARIQRACMDLFIQGKMTGEPIVSPVVPFEALMEEYLKIASKPGPHVKIGCSF